MREGVTTDERDRIKTLEREVQLNDIGPLSERRVQRGKSSGTGRPPSACFKIPNICVSLNRRVFILDLLVHFAEKILLLNPTIARGDYRTP